MLQYCPKLQALKIKKVCLTQQWIVTSFYLFFSFLHVFLQILLSHLQSTDSSTKADWKYPCHVPECVTSRLTTCRIENYEASEADFLFSTYILLNARLLQVMTIFRTLDLKPTGSPHFSKDLSSCPTISPTCKLEVI